jgi:hypothetical protein
MTLSTIICGYIYAGFLVVKAALEAGLLYAKAIITTLNSFVMAIENMIKNTFLVVFDAAMAGYQILCKYLTDWIVQKTHAKEYLDKFCKSIFKCSYVLTQLLDPSSAITKTLVKNFEYDAEPQGQLYDAVASFDNFKKQICSAGFTFMWGLNYFRDYSEQILAQINEWVDIITSNRKRIKKRLESYFYAIEDYGIFDLLDKLHAFFNCVLDAAIDTCSSIATSQNFYKKCTGALHITEIGVGQYKLTDSWLKQKLGTCDNATRQLNGLSAQLTKALIDAGITSKNLANAQASFNLANFVRDTKRALDKGDLHQIPGVRLFEKTWNSAGDFGTALGSCMSKIADAAGDAITNIDLSWDNILEHLYWKDNEIVFIADNDLTVDLTDIFIEKDTEINTISVSVNETEAEFAEDTLKRFYWTSDGRLVSNGYIVDQIANNTTDQAIVDEITTKVSIVNDMSDITQTVKKY